MPTSSSVLASQHRLRPITSTSGNTASDFPAPPASAAVGSTPGSIPPVAVGQISSSSSTTPANISTVAKPGRPVGPVNNPVPVGSSRRTIIPKPSNANPSTTTHHSSQGSSLPRSQPMLSAIGYLGDHPKQNDLVAQLICQVCQPSFTMVKLLEAQIQGQKDQNHDLSVKIDGLGVKLVEGDKQNEQLRIEGEKTKKKLKEMEARLANAEALARGHNSDTAELARPRLGMDEAEKRIESAEKERDNIIIEMGADIKTKKNNISGKDEEIETLNIMMKNVLEENKSMEEARDGAIEAVELTSAKAIKRDVEVEKEIYEQDRKAVIAEGRAIKAERLVKDGLVREKDKETENDNLRLEIAGLRRKLLAAEA